VVSKKQSTLPAWPGSVEVEDVAQLEEVRRTTLARPG